MKVIDILKSTKESLFSFEILPPLKGKSIEEIYAAIDPLMEFNPMNINVTYHQQEVEYREIDGNIMEKRIVRKRPGTVAISAAIKYKYKTTVVPHIICGGFTKEETEDALIDLHFLGMKNLLVLRGDPIKSERYFRPEPGGHRYAADLVKQIMNMNQGIYLDEDIKYTFPTDFSVGVAAYPEKHIESPNMDEDLKYLKQKVEAGADYIVTQMFFDNKKFFDFVKLCRDRGIMVPIVPGLKPVNTKKDLRLLPQVFNIDLPSQLFREVENCKDNAEARQIGIEWCIQQSKELKEAGVPVIHYYTIGQSDNIREIAKRVF